MLLPFSMHIPLCPYYNQCGGCTTQHIPYEAQLLSKKKALVTAIAYPEEEINIVSDKEYFYRNKMEFIFHERIIGLRKKGNPNIIVHINHCVIAEEAINNLLKETQAFFKNIDTYNKKRKNGTFVSVTLRTSKTEQGICFMLYENSSKLAEAIELIKKYAQDSSAQNIMIAYVTDKEEIIEPFVVKGNDYLTVTYLGKTFQYSLIYIIVITRSKNLKNFILCK